MHRTLPRRALSFAAPVLALAFTISPAAADVITEGYQSSPQPKPMGVLRTLASGDVLAFDGATVARFDAGGFFLETVFTLPGSFFTGCFAVNPEETRALVGESLNGVLYDVDLVNGGGVALTVLDFNFDAVFDSANTALVSAATCGFCGDNDLLRVDLDTGDATLLATVAGASGPVALAEDGDLFYGTTSAAFPAPEGETQVLRFAAADLTGSPVLAASDATLVAAGLDGAFGLAYDPSTGLLFLAENHFGTGLNRLVEISTTTGSVRPLVVGTTFDFLSDIEFLPGAGAFLGYQPETSGRLNYSITDFLVDERRALTPARPTFALSGAGTGGGSGHVALDIEGGPANGLAVLFYAPLGAVAPSETSYLVGGLPLFHTAMAPLSIQILPTVLPLDGSGTGATGFQNNAGLVDAFALQAMILDTLPSVVGSTTAATL